jgi:hypothetical protein
MDSILGGYWPNQVNVVDNAPVLQLVLSETIRMGGIQYYI